ncbi:hypothetical protein AH4AK4_0019 [Aeromonas hydrophila 4AK4]|nr:hypothetical protein AH4AK4_0019 [Aeromonas hydrophila 4AK4]
MRDVVKTVALLASMGMCDEVKAAGALLTGMKQEHGNA